jgi:hypothetical protein
MKLEIIYSFFSILGPEKFYELTNKLPNERVPGQKALQQLKRDKFLRDYDDGKLTVAQTAGKYGIPSSTAYHWIHTKNHARRKPAHSQGDAARPHEILTNKS